MMTRITKTGKGFKAAILTGATMLSGVLAPMAFANDIPVPRLKPSPYLELELTQNEAPLIGIARIEDGKLVAAPASELLDWVSMDNRVMDNVATFKPLSPVKLASLMPENQSIDSDNKIDEIRMAAADSGMRYVIIYGFDRDAAWNSFGRQKLSDTGLYVPAGHKLSAKGKVKALIVGTYSGTIYGTVTSNDLDEGLGNFTKRVEDVVKALPDREAPENLI